MDDREARTAVLKPLVGIRFIAVSATVIHHTSVGWLGHQSWIPAPLFNLVFHFNMGLGFFFILSGFILQTLYRGRLSEQGSWRRYGVSRIARIYPVFVLGVLMMVPFRGSLSWDALPQFFLIQCWRGYSVAAGWQNWNMPTWMLSVEFFFYLCFPLICRLVERAPRGVLIAAIAAAAIFAFATGSVDPPLGHARFAWMTWIPLPLLRLPEFVAGTMIAELQARRGVRKLPVPPELSLLVFAVVLAWPGFAVQAAVAIVLATVVILGLVNAPDAPFTRLMNTRIFLLLGASSYALYVVHEPVNFMLRSVVDRWWMLVQYPIAIGLAIGLLLWFETPVRRWINARFSPREKPTQVEEQTAVVSSASAATF